MGDAGPERPGEGDYELFDRWLAHRERTDDQAAPPAPTPGGTAVDTPLFADTSTATALAAERDEAPETPPADARPQHDAARTVLAALAESRPGPVTPPRPTTEVRQAAAPRAPSPPAVGMPAVVEFAPRRGVRRVVGVLLLLALAATALTGYVAWQDRTTTNIGVAATLGLLTGVIWAVRSGSAVAVLSVRGGMLVVERGGGRHQFDLASHYTPVEVVGEPGGRGWKVLFHRRGMAPFVVDASMVDPVEFTRVVRYYRPED